MHSSMHSTIRTFAIAGIVSASLMGTSAVAQTPQAGGCADLATPAASTGMHHGGMHHSTPESMPGMDHGHMEIGFDLMYIDMMIPHHESVIALAEVAQGELTDPRLVQMAEDILANQDAEIEELQTLRDEWYPDADPVSMDAMHGMPGMSGDMASMEQQMSAEWQVQTFCAAGDKDLAFIEQVIPHHQMAVDTSEAALEHAEHQEIKDISQRVIEDQEAEIEELEAIRDELQATPAT
jgi:uncharacterized protein (DUF305 family)